eukprot:maker-scaffold699_size109694-snap-gene-0.21 protein:Tk03218 transcript:maker-scaffold699_size109694-snap-gene-0.21-mRNA-1 annotation:"PREDICTED: uncharacterized protein LOC103312404"
MATMKASLILLVLALTIQGSQGLRCYTCDNVGSGEECINNPSQVENGANECNSPNDEFCYTSRLEEGDGKLTFNRGCCRVKTASPVCPPGDDFQIIENTNPPFKKFLTRCKDSNCNDDTGDEGGSNSDGGGSIVVPGNHNFGVRQQAIGLMVVAGALIALIRPC